MANSHSIGSDAFRWLDQHLIESLSAPDEAFDWVFMLRDGDWLLFEAVWDDRPAEWREAFASVFCEGPIRESQALLRRALFDANSNVACEAACTLCRQYQLDPQLVVLDSMVVDRLKHVFEQNGGRHMEEVDAVLRQLE